MSLSAPRLSLPAELLDVLARRRSRRARRRSARPCRAARSGPAACSIPPLLPATACVCVHSMQPMRPASTRPSAVLPEAAELLATPLLPPEAPSAMPPLLPSPLLPAAMLPSAVLLPRPAEAAAYNALAVRRRAGSRWRGFCRRWLADLHCAHS